jgi:hypothetical protein
MASDIAIVMKRQGPTNALPDLHANPDATAGVNNRQK